MVLNNIVGTLMQNLIQNTIGIKRWSITLSITIMKTQSGTYPTTDTSASSSLQHIRYNSQSGQPSAPSLNIIYITLLVESNNTHLCNTIANTIKCFISITSNLECRLLSLCSKRSKPVSGRPCGSTYTRVRVYLNKELQQTRYKLVNTGNRAGYCVSVL